LLSAACAAEYALVGDEAKQVLESVNAFHRGDPVPRLRRP
jgi:hypothetical protein